MKLAPKLPTPSSRPLVYSAACFLMTLFASKMAFAQTAPELASPELYEIRSYIIGEDGDAEAVQAFLREALVPALNRQGIEKVGVFTNSASDETKSKRYVVVIPFESAGQLATLNASIAGEETYQTAAKDYLVRGPKNSPYERIESELLAAMDCWKELAVPAGTTDNEDRVYELRVYESANERLGNLKVDMFNSGEVPIFLDCGIMPIFIGQAVVGPQTPNLTYLTLYPNEQARLDAWKAFRVNADWQVLKVVPKYQGTVSKIDKYVLVPTVFSQM